MDETHVTASTMFWRWLRIILLGLATFFLVGMAFGFVGAHLFEGGDFGFLDAGILALILLCLAGCGWKLKRDFQAAVPPISGDAGEGERLYAGRSRKLWRIIGGLALVGFAIGAAGSLLWLTGGGAAALAPWIATSLALGVIVLALLISYGSWRFFVSVDEVEVADNLWGSMIGFYAYAILFPVWWALNWLGRAPEPNDWAIFAAALAAAVFAYGYRKWRNR